MNAKEYYKSITSISPGKNYSMNMLDVYKFAESYYQAKSKEEAEIFIKDFISHHPEGELDWINYSANDVADIIRRLAAFGKEGE